MQGFPWASSVRIVLKSAPLGYGAQVRYYVALIYVLIYVCGHIERGKNEYGSDTGISGNSAKKALSAHAKRNGRKVAEVMRDAVDAALLGVTTDELTRLDVASRKVGEFIDAIRVDLANNTKEHNSFMRQIAKLRNAP